MYVINGIAYAGELVSEIAVSKVLPLNDMMLLLFFNTGEKRLYDAAPLLKCPAFKPLENNAVFNAVSVERGVVVWLDGEIDIAPETLYKDSFAYQEAMVV